MQIKINKYSSEPYNSEVRKRQLQQDFVMLSTKNGGPPPGQWHLLSKPHTVLCALVKGLWPKLVLQFLNFLTSELDFTAASLWLQTSCVFLKCVSVSLEAVYLKTFRLRMKNILKSTDNLWFTKTVVALWNFVIWYSVCVSLTFFLRNHWKESCITWIEKVFEESVRMFVLKFFMK